MKRNVLTKMNTSAGIMLSTRKVYKQVTGIGLSVMLTTLASTSVKNTWKRKGKTMNERKRDRMAKKTIRKLERSVAYLVVGCAGLVSGIATIVDICKGEKKDG